MKLDNNSFESIKRYFEIRPVLKAYLFGSYARNEADYQSDLDILADLDYSQGIGLAFIQMRFACIKQMEVIGEVSNPISNERYDKILNN